MAWKWVMGISVVIGLVGMIMAVLTMVGLPFGIYDLTTGGYLRGAQTLFLFVIALYCLWRVEMSA
jgi:hypothetical protein